MKIALIALPQEVSFAAAAVTSLNERYGGDAIDLFARTPDSFKTSGHVDEFLQFAGDAAMVIFHLMGGKAMLKDHDIILPALKDKNIPVFAAGMPVDAELAADSTVNDADYQAIDAYLKHGGEENLENLVRFVANRFGGQTLEVDPPVSFPLEGIYHPGMGYVETLAGYMETRYQAQRPTIGILCGPNPSQKTEDHFVDSLIWELEDQGANAYSVFLSGTDPQGKNLRWVVEQYFMKEGTPVVDTVISLHGHSIAAYLPSESVTDLFLSLNVPCSRPLPPPIPLSSGKRALWDWGSVKSPGAWPCPNLTGVSSPCPWRPDRYQEKILIPARKNRHLCPLPSASTSWPD